MATMKELRNRVVSFNEFKAQQSKLGIDTSGYVIQLLDATPTQYDKLAKEFNFYGDNN